MYNGIDVLQTHDYIKISTTTFIDKICDKCLSSWMNNFTTTKDRPTSLPSDPSWLKKFNAAIGDPDPDVQKKLTKSMQLTYRCGVGELIWAMTTTRPDLAHASIKLSQANCCPHDHHHHGVTHALKYLYATRADRIYFWRTAPCPEFKEGPLPQANSNKQDLLLDMTRPKHDVHVLHAYADSDWATCVKTRCSFGGAVLRLAGGTIAYKCKFQTTVAGSSTEAEFMVAYNTGKMILFMQSVLWDLWIPQEAATVLYEDNDLCTAMGNAHKPTTRTRHLDIKYFSICKWVDRDLMLLKGINKKLNISDHLMKGLTRALFHRHTNFLLGHIPPAYSPVYTTIIGPCTDTFINIDDNVPDSFITPTCAAANRVHAPLKADYAGYPWLILLWNDHGLYNP